MAEYIERELAIEALSRGEGCGNVCRRAIERILAADVAPVRHGRWLGWGKSGTPTYENYGTCSVCGEDAEIYTEHRNYCPNCGAKMDEGLTMDVNKNLKEKLVDLLDQFVYDDWYGNGDIAEKLIANGVTVQEWISVDDRLPEEKVDCIVHYKHAYCDNDDYWAIGICFYDGEKFQIDLSYKVTHWQYLPQPPKGE